MVDVIVPIYNAFDSVTKCIESLLLFSNFKENRLILIDDKSPDNRIVSYINKIVSENEDKNIIFLENDTNMGFVATVNKGMKYSENDVILLNTPRQIQAFVN